MKNNLRIFISDPKKFLNKMVTVIIDRPMGSRHPKYKKLYYVQNYGYIPNTKAPDGDELDAYVLDVFEPIKKSIGRCIAIIHRINDDDDKLVVVPDGFFYTDEQIVALTEFQEKPLFKSIIIRPK